MKDFSFCIPTRFVVGRDSASQVGELIRQYGGRKVLIVEDGGSYLAALLENVRASIKCAGLEAVQ
ncbi:MAG: iron-containing alcohol dehydrogenase, partial [Spirochaetales bacterium]|nr:iron-containing alcohol dehydrogenase [Spirochaetales bacterium]